MLYVLYGAVMMLVMFCVRDCDRVTCELTIKNVVVDYDVDCCFID